MPSSRCPLRLATRPAPARFIFALALLCAAAVSPWAYAKEKVAEAPAAPQHFRIAPDALKLEGNFARAQLLVIETDAKGAATPGSADLTHAVEYLSSQPKVVAVDAQGRLLAVGNGKATITATLGGASQQAEVEVTGVEPVPVVSFDDDVLPVISRAGCNAAACHASQYGKGGFVLSVFGFDRQMDYNNMSRDRQGRRVNLQVPEQSLLLLKPTMSVPHGGQRRLTKGSPDYEIIRQWIAAGLQKPAAEPAKVTGIEVTPQSLIGRVGLKQQLRVVATYSDGRQRDVTHWSWFDSTDDGVLRISDEGRVEAIGQGQASAMVRFEGQAVVAMFSVPFNEQIELPGWKNNNFVDELASAKFRELGIEPSELCDDATFIRRTHLDAVGTLPTPEAVRAFIDSDDAEKRAKLIDQLLGLTGDPELDVHNNAYAAYWSLKWADLIRSSSNNLGEQGMWAMHNWLQESFRDNKPFDQFVEDLVMAKGSIYMNGPANYYRIATNPPDLAEATAQLFLGVRLQCAKCHHHPFEKYSQEDYYGFAAFFARVGNKNSVEFGLFGREQIVMVKPTGDVKHPRTGKTLLPTPLEGQPLSEEPLDRRQPLADWLTSADNPLMARSVVNRYMAYLLGRGLVEPIDDMRATNPPTSAALLDALAESFTESGYDLKQLVRTIMNSRLYQLSSQPTESNAGDDRFYSHYRVKRISAEALLDAIDDATGTQTKFRNMPLGTRAIELPDAEYPDYFLTTFGKPRRVSACECERVSDENLAQALHTLNGEGLVAKIADSSGRVATLMKAKKPYEEIVHELYLATMGRLATAEELKALDAFREKTGDDRVFYEDLLWSLLNSKPFLFVR